MFPLFNIWTMFLAALIFKEEKEEKEVLKVSVVLNISNSF